MLVELLDPAQTAGPVLVSAVAGLAGVGKYGPACMYARYVRLVRFSFLILIGRFVTLEP